MTAPLWAILGSYNEVDIVFATVSNAFAQGAERVLVVDNGSDDGTLVEARRAGAEITHSFETDLYDEMQRIRIMNDLVHVESQASEHDAIWWLWLDCDEFPCAPGGQRLVDFLKGLGDDIRTVGADQINHFPSVWPAYRPRFHPWEFMPLAETFDTTAFPVGHCPSRHWKHPLHKFVRDRPPIRVKSGFHMAMCEENLKEPAQAIELHHFPFRAPRETYDRYAKLCGSENVRNAYNDNTSIQNKSALTKRFEMLDTVYEGLWGDVYINPAPMGHNDKAKPGVAPTPHPFTATRWYDAGQVPDPTLFAGLRCAVLCGKEDEPACRGLVAARLLALLGARVTLVAPDPTALAEMQEITGTQKLRVSRPGEAGAQDVAVIAGNSPWIKDALRDMGDGAHDLAVAYVEGAYVPDGPDMAQAVCLSPLPAPAQMSAPQAPADRDDTVVVLGDLDAPTARAALHAVLRPDLGGISFLLTGQTPQENEDSLLGLVDAADLIGARLMPVNAWGPVDRATALSRTRAVFVVGDADHPALLEAAIMGVPVVLAPTLPMPAVLEGHARRPGDTGLDALSQTLAAALNADRSAPAGSQLLWDMRSPRRSAALLGDRLAEHPALKSRPRATPSGAPKGAPASSPKAGAEGFLCASYRPFRAHDGTGGHGGSDP